MWTKFGLGWVLCADVPQMLVTNCFTKLADAGIDVGRLLCANQAVWVGAIPPHNTWTPEKRSTV